MQSCATLKSRRKEIICGSNCEITSVTKTGSETPRLRCFVYDKNDFGNPLVGVLVSIQGTDIKTITNIEGKVELEIPAGKHKIEVRFIGCESIEKYIDFAPCTITEIRVEMGAEDNNMGLPKDYYEKPWKYPGAVY